MEIINTEIMTSQQKAKKRHNFENLCERLNEIYNCQI